MWTPGRVLRWYLAFSITGIVIFIALFLIAGSWPQALPLVLATLVSVALIFWYIAWRDYLR